MRKTNGQEQPEQPANWIPDVLRAKPEDMINKELLRADPGYVERLRSSVSNELVKEGLLSAPESTPPSAPPAEASEEATKGAPAEPAPDPEPPEELPAFIPKDRLFSHTYRAERALRLAAEAREQELIAQLALLKASELKNKARLEHIRASAEGSVLAKEFKIGEGGFWDGETGQINRPPRK